MSTFLKSLIYGNGTPEISREMEYSIESNSSTSGQPSIDIELAQHTDSEAHGHVEDDASSDRSDTPPAFPAMNSAQRITTSSSSPSPNIPNSSQILPSILTDSKLMPPPPLPGKALRVPGVQPLSSSQSLLSVSGSSLSLPPSTNKPPVKKFREKVALAPGFGPLDWAALKSSGSDLRGVDSLIRVTPSMLREHKTKEDAWTAINGKVYNITPYLPFHPGGEKELLRVAGRDGTKLFGLTHAWVNADFMLDACLVGFLVSEPRS